MHNKKALLSDIVYCKRPLCSAKGSAWATHELVFGNQILPICDNCAEDALKQEGFARMPDTNIIVMQLPEAEDMVEGLCVDCNEISPGPFCPNCDGGRS